MVTYSWVKDLSIKNKKLTFNDLLLPGTHNSCSYSFNKQLIYLTHSYLLECCIIAYFIKNWTINQSYNIYKQLTLGIRVFNIDVSYSEDVFYTSHTFFINKLEYDLKDIFEYNKKFNEFIILSFILQDIPEDNIEDLENLIRKYFHENTIYPIEYNDPLNISLYELYNENKNILIYFEKNTTSKSDYLFYSHKDLYVSSWENTNSINKFKKKCIKRLDTFHTIKNNNSKIFCDLNWTLTPNYKQILKNIFLCCNKENNNLKEWIKPFNKELIPFIKTHKKLIKHINSISIDFANYDIITELINIQFQK